MSTPLIRQYQELKKEYQDMLLFFQVGDFYELFFEDAKQASSFLGIALTKRGKHNGQAVPLCGVPVHALDHHLTKLIRGGFRVAIADQLSEPKPGTVVERGVTKVLTPGTLTDEHLLEEKSSSYILSFYPMKNQWGLIFGELLTAQLFATTLPVPTEKNLEAELIRFFPDEVLIANECHTAAFDLLFRRYGCCSTIVGGAVDSIEAAEVNQWMHEQFDVVTRRTIEEQKALHYALVNFYAYFKKNQVQALHQFNTVTLYNSNDFLILDGPTQRNLELVKNNQDGGRKNSLLAVIDHAITPMGSRMLKKWILQPLNKKDSIYQRQESIKALIDNLQSMYALEKLFKQIGDIERIVGRIALHRATFHDYKILHTVLVLIPEIKGIISSKEYGALLCCVSDTLIGFSELQQLLKNALNTDENVPWFIKKGFSTELDAMREHAEKGSLKIIELEKKEQDLTGISSLKIRYNKVHGYYIEITKANVHAIPDRYTRLQTLVGKERFVTPELQQMQHDINTAQDNVESIEKQLFNKVQAEVHQHVVSLRKLAHNLAHIDALRGLAHVAYQNQYVCPTINDDHQIVIVQGRHPVIEKRVAGKFIPNDTALVEEASLWIITGPNMGGKSTYLRQTALLVILAHLGSFVPADSADIALLDRIFTRIGAGDNLAEGKSTFLIEMEEAASICRDATSNSLIILDEIGRGTSTFDGLALAHAIVEYVYTTIKARCLFATHYHELHQLSSFYKGIVSYHAACKKREEGVLFLHTIVEGIAEGSFGIEVAKIAKLPKAIIFRAQELLKTLTTHANHQSASKLIEMVTRLQEQNKVLQARIDQLSDHQRILLDINYETLSPKQAFDLLWSWKESVVD